MRIMKKLESLKQFAHDTFLFNEMFTDHEITSDKYLLYTKKVPHYEMLDLLLFPFLAICRTQLLPCVPRIIILRD